MLVLNPLFGLLLIMVVAYIIVEWAYKFLLKFFKEHVL